MKFLSIYMDEEGRVASGKVGSPRASGFGQDLKEKEKEKQTGMVSVADVLSDVLSSVRCYRRAVLLGRINPSSP